MSDCDCNKSIKRGPKAVSHCDSCCKASTCVICKRCKRGPTGPVGPTGPAGNDRVILQNINRIVRFVNGVDDPQQIINSSGPADYEFQIGIAIATNIDRIIFFVYHDGAWFAS